MDDFKTSTYLALLALVVLVGFAGAYAFTTNARYERQAEDAFQAFQPVRADSLGPMAPDFALERLNGETFRLSEHRGTVVAINVWATWCPPCREEIPDLIQLQEQMRGDVLVVGVSLDKRPPAIVRDFAERVGINYPIMMGDGTVLDKYGPLPGIPTTFVVGPAGRVRLQAVGLLTTENARPVLRTLAEDQEVEEVKPPFQKVKKL